MHPQTAAPAEVATPTELLWRSSALVSCLHAAEIIRRDPQACDATLTGVLSGPVSRLQKTLETLSLPPQRFWDHVVPLSANLTSLRQLAEVTSRKLVPGDVGGRIGPLADALSELDVAFRTSWHETPDRARATPSATAAPEPRATPLPTYQRNITADFEQMDPSSERSVLLQGRWLAEGQAVLHAIGNLTEPELIVSRAEVLMVIPVRSGNKHAGGGVAHLHYNSVRMESVEAEADPLFPDPVRLAWLIAQLNLEVPRFSETIPKPRLSYTASAAMLPAALDAAHQMALVPPLREALPLALAHWQPDIEKSATVATNLQRWWDGYCQKRPAWSVALAALERLLP